MAQSNLKIITRIINRSQFHYYRHILIEVSISFRRHLEQSIGIKNTLCSYSRRLLLPLIGVILFLQPWEITLFLLHSIQQIFFQDLLVRLTDITTNNGPLHIAINPPGNMAIIVEPIISIIKKIEGILVKTPTNKAIPLITSSSPIRITKSASNPIFQKHFSTSNV